MSAAAVYIPCRDEAEARRLAGLLLEKRLIACANILPSRSVYRWKGRVEDESESMLICKTLGQRVEDIKKEVKEAHSYETPAVLSWAVGVGEDYERWLRQEIGQEPGKEQGREPEGTG